MPQAEATLTTRQAEPAKSENEICSPSRDIILKSWNRLMRQATGRRDLPGSGVHDGHEDRRLLLCPHWIRAFTTTKANEPLTRTCELPLLTRTDTTAS